MFWAYIMLVVVFLALEAVSFNLVSIWMALAAVIASIYAWFFPYRYATQMVIFLTLSIIFIIVTKPLAKKVVKKPVKTNIDALIGEDAVVIEKINSLNSTGMVRVRGQVWSAKSTSASEIREDARVKIIGIEGVKLVVELV